MKGIEPSWKAWKASALPLSYTRVLENPPEEPPEHPPHTRTTTYEGTMDTL